MADTSRVTMTTHRTDGGRNTVRRAATIATSSTTSGTATSDSSQRSLHRQHQFDTSTTSGLANMTSGGGATLPLLQRPDLHTICPMPSDTLDYRQQSIVNGRCSCCPYGYHVDVDFLHYLESLGNEGVFINNNRKKELETKRTGSKLDTPVRAPLSPEERNNNNNKTSSSLMLKSNSTTAYDDIIEKRRRKLLDSIDFDSLQDPLKSPLSAASGTRSPLSVGSGGGGGRSPLSVGSGGGGKSPTPNYIATGLKSANVSPKIISAGPASNVKSRPHIPVMQSGPGPRQNTSPLLAPMSPSGIHSSSMRITLQSKAPGAGPAIPVPASVKAPVMTHVPAPVMTHVPAPVMAPVNPHITKNGDITDELSLMAIRNQMALSLRRMKELEDQVKCIPSLQIRISTLNDDKRKLADKLKVALESGGRESRDLRSECTARERTHEMRTVFLTSGGGGSGGGSTVSPKVTTRSVGVGDHVVDAPAEESSVHHHHDKELRTVIIGGGTDGHDSSTSTSTSTTTSTLNANSSGKHISPKKVSTRNVGIVCKVATRDVAVMVQFKQEESNKTDDSGDIWRTTTDIKNQLTTMQQINLAAFQSKHVHIKIEDLREIIDTILHKDIHSVGVQTSGIGVTTREVGIMHSGMGSRSLGVGDHSVNVEVRPLVTRRSVACEARRLLQNRATNTDRILAGITIPTQTAPPVKKSSRGTLTTPMTRYAVATNTATMPTRTICTGTESRIFKSNNAIKDTGTVTSTPPTFAVAVGTADRAKHLTYEKASNTSYSPSLAEEQQQEEEEEETTITTTTTTTTTANDREGGTHSYRRGDELTGSRSSGTTASRSNHSTAGQHLGEKRISQSTSKSISPSVRNIALKQSAATSSSSSSSANTTAAARTVNVGTAAPTATTFDQMTSQVTSTHVTSPVTSTHVTSPVTSTQTSYDGGDTSSNATDDTVIDTTDTYSIGGGGVTGGVTGATTTSRYSTTTTGGGSTRNIAVTANVRPKSIMKHTTGSSSSSSSSSSTSFRRNYRQSTPVVTVTTSGGGSTGSATCGLVKKEITFSDDVLTKCSSSSSSTSSDGESYDEASYDGRLGSIEYNNSSKELEPDVDELIEELRDDGGGEEEVEMNEEMEVNTEDIERGGDVTREQSVESSYECLVDDIGADEIENLPSDIEKACRVYSTWLHDSTTITTKQFNASKSKLQSKWFEIASHKKSNYRMVRRYINAFAEFSKDLVSYVINMADSNGNTTLHYAVSHGNMAVVQVLISRGADVCKVDARNRAGYTSIMLAALVHIDNADQAVVITKLFNNGDIDARATQAGQTALMLATSHGRVDMVKLLMHAGAEINLRDDDGSTALMCASEHGHSDIVKILLAHPDIDPSLTDNDNSTAMSIAMEAGHRDIGVLLYAHVNFKSNSAGQISKRTKTQKKLIIRKS